MLLDLQIFRNGTGHGEEVRVFSASRAAPLFDDLDYYRSRSAGAGDDPASASDADFRTGIPTNSDIHRGDFRRISLNHGASGDPRGKASESFARAAAYGCVQSFWRQCAGVYLALLDRY